LEDSKLFILWTNADPLTSEKMVMMYATNSRLKNWWDQVVVIIWGATAKYVAEDRHIQEKIKTAQLAGVSFSACKACADQLGVTDQLVDMGIEVFYWGEPLTQILRDNEKLITI
jgi:hypothetical protein